MCSLNLKIKSKVPVLKISVFNSSSGKRKLQFKDKTAFSMQIDLDPHCLQMQVKLQEGHEGLRLLVPVR